MIIYISILFLPACSDEKIAEAEIRGHKIELSVGFFDAGDSRISADADFITAFDPGDSRPSVKNSDFNETHYIQTIQLINH